MSTYTKNITDLTDVLNSGELNRKKHWKLYQRTFKYARLNTVADKDKKIISDIIQRDIIYCPPLLSLLTECK